MALTNKTMTPMDFETNIDASNITPRILPQRETRDAFFSMRSITRFHARCCIRDMYVFKLVHDLIKPLVWSRRFVAKFV